MGGALWRVAAEVGGHHGGIIRHGRRRSVGDFPTEVEHHDPLAHAHDQSHVVVDQQDGQTVRIELLDQLSHPVFLGRVHAGGRFVEDEELRFQRQGARHLQAALVAVRQCRRSPLTMLVRIEADGLEQLASLLESPVIQAHQRPQRE